MITTDEVAGILPCSLRQAFEYVCEFMNTPVEDYPETFDEMFIPGELEEAFMLKVALENAKATGAFG